MFLFKTRELAREFKAKNTNYKLVDRGVDVAKRWGVKVVIKKTEQ